jgi:phage tail P2-like protein
MRIKAVREIKNIYDLDLLDILPSSISDDENVVAMAKAIGPELQSVSRDTREALIISRIEELPEAVIDLLAWQWHVDFYRPELPLSVKRRLVKGSVAWHRKKGTLWAVKKVLEDLGFKATVAEWFDLDSEPHTFSVTGYYEDSPYNVLFLGQATEEILTEAVFEAKPERSWLTFLAITPPPPDRTDHYCRWDVCTWEHGEYASYEWSDSGLDEGLFPDSGIQEGYSIGRSDALLYKRGKSWNISFWEDGFGSRPREGIFTESGFADEISYFESLVTSPQPAKWSNTLTWNTGGTWIYAPAPDWEAECPGGWTFE